MRELLPVRIVRGLGVRENQHFIVLIGSWCIERLPVRRRVPRRNAVLIHMPRRQLIELRRVLIDLGAVVGKACILCSNAAHILCPLQTQLNHLLIDGRRHFPHEGACVRIVRRDNLPQALDIEYARELAQRRIAHASQQIELPERGPSHRKHARRRSRTNEISTIHLLIFHRSFLHTFPRPPIITPGVDSKSSVFHQLMPTAYNRRKARLPSAYVHLRIGRASASHPRS